MEFRLGPLRQRSALLCQDYAPLIVAYRNGAPVRLSDVATVVDREEDIRNAGIGQWQAPVLIMHFPPARR